MKKLIPAFALLLISAVVLSTASFAWFSMNTQVIATGMKVQAKAEGGIVISNSEKSSWGQSASVTADTAALLPVSTKDLSTWYHGTSEDPSKANASSSTYANNAETITLKTSGNIGYFDADNNSTLDATEDAYYLVTNYYIKSTTAEALQTSLYINKIEVSASGSNTSALNGSLRIAVKYGSSFTTIFGGTASSTTEYYVGGQSETKTTINAYTAKNVQIAGVTSIANTDAGATLVQIYVWYEGEDTNNLSNNIAGLTPDTLTVSVNFGTTTIE